MHSGTIDTIVEAASNYLINKVSGSPHMDDYIAVLQVNLDQRPEYHVIWDYSDADLTQLSSEHLQRIVDYILAHPRGQVTKRVALVVPAHLAYGMGRMLETLAELSKAPWVMELFRDLDSARTWIADPGSN